MSLTIALDQEEDGRWLAEVIELPGALAYGATRTEAGTRAQVLALRILAQRLEHGEDVPLMDAFFSIRPSSADSATNPSPASV